MMDKDKVKDIAGYFMGLNGDFLPREALELLVYLTERRCLIEYGFSECEGSIKLVNGVPTLEGLYDAIWNDEAIAIKSRDEADLLSNAVVAIIEELWERYAGYDSQLLEKHCGQLAETNTPISYEQFYYSCGWSKGKSKFWAEEVEAGIRVDKTFKAIREKWNETF